MTAPKLRDVELLQWMADFLSQMFDLSEVDVTGGKRQTSVTTKSGAKGGKNIISVSN